MERVVAKRKNSSSQSCGLLGQRKGKSNPKLAIYIYIYILRRPPQLKPFLVFVSGDAVKAEEVTSAAKSTILHRTYYMYLLPVGVLRLQCR